MAQQHETKERAQQQFDRWARSYDRSILNHLLFRPSYMLMLEEIAHWRTTNHEPFTVLDIGCGTGSFAELLRGTSWPVKVIGVDLSFEMCVAADRKGGETSSQCSTSFINADSEHLPIPSGSVDIVTCANSFHHYPHQQTVVHEFRRVLRRNGRLILVDGFRDNAVGWVIFDVFVNHFESGVHHAPWTTMREYFAASGLRNVRQRKSGILPPILVTVGDLM